MFTVLIKKKVVRDAEKMPAPIQRKLAALIEALEERGPILPGWPNYGKLEKNVYHCHLSHKWVACWYCEDNSVIIEVYYAGSRENAPY
jgi:mRNA-degrading endonuclease RelE of RelBE toxin-antitoxin system